MEKDSFPCGDVMTAETFNLMMGHIFYDPLELDDEVEQLQTQVLLEDW